MMMMAVMLMMVAVIMSCSNLHHFGSDCDHVFCIVRPYGQIVIMFFVSFDPMVRL